MKRNISLLLIIALLLAFSSSASAATIGTPLTSPEAGWQRIDDNSPIFTYGGGAWNREALASHYGGYLAYPSSPSGTIQFNFKGTRLRILDARHPTHSTAVNITIDGVTETYTQNGPLTFQVMDYEKLGLSYTDHSVSIIATNNLGVRFDAIDIDADRSINLLQGINSANQRVFIVNYDTSRTIPQSSALPLGYGSVK